MRRLAPASFASCVALSAIMASVAGCASSSQPTAEPTHADVEVAIPPAPAVASSGPAPLEEPPEPPDDSAPPHDSEDVSPSAVVTVDGWSGAGPRGEAVVGAPSASSGVPDVARVVAGMRFGFRRCYLHALGTDPALQGRVVVRATLGANGEVTSVALDPTTLPSVLTACVQARVAAAQFSPPDQAPTVLTIPVEFAPP
jgi:outer membrane biosynthesis protein TonB